MVRMIFARGGEDFRKRTSGGSRTVLLNELATKHGTDKADGRHGYIRKYQERWASRQGDPITLLELGIGGGGSLRMWSEWFPAGLIVGVDANSGCGKQATEHIRVVIGDACAPDTAKQVIRESPAFDFIIDDASHVAEQQLKVFALYWPLLRPGGDFVFEDLHTSYWGHGYSGHCKPIIEWLKDRIDELNAFGRFSEADNVNASGRWETEVESLTFHRSLCFIRRKPLTSAEAAARGQIVHQRLFQYTRVGYDSREMEFLENGTIGKGRAGCEQSWYVREEFRGTVSLVIGVGGRMTCQVRLGGDGAWRGSWVIHERMPVELVPLKK